MLPLSSKVAFLLFAIITLALGMKGFYRVFLRIRRGAPDNDLRFDRKLYRLQYALRTTLLQNRTFRDRRLVSIFHSFIFYGFTFYILVNLVDAVAGYVDLQHLPLVHSKLIATTAAIYSFLADGLSFLVLVGVVALVIRRFCCRLNTTSASTGAHSYTRTLGISTLRATQSSSPLSFFSTLEAV